MGFCGDEAIVWCFKYILVVACCITNLLCGCALLGVGLWLCFDPSMREYASTAGDLQIYYIAVYVLIGIGGFMMLVGFLGCCGACMESQALLVLFFILLLVICAAEVGGGVWAYLNREKLKEGVKQGMTATIKDVYSEDAAVTAALDSMQRTLKCCGADSPLDYATSRYALTNPLQVPDSCCKSVSEDCGTGFKSIATLLNLPDVGIHTEGCADSLFSLLEENTILVAGLAIGVGAVQILGMIFSCCLCCAIRRQDDNKYYA
ncbi:CD63 antigen-like isoform X1 [Diadema setosum]|uniref:CD63 antigen-like isoform X1 n=1 Tax=Diadema setosum TaxID=31175 RepID=UPI003B3A8709